MKDDIRDKIVKAWKQFGDEHHKQPTRLRLTVDDEYAVLLILAEISESLAQRAFTEGVRIAVQKIFGFEVAYGADKFGFEQIS